MALEISDNGLAAFDSFSNGRSDAEAHKQWKQPSATNTEGGNRSTEGVVRLIIFLYLDM